MLFHTESDSSLPAYASECNEYDALQIYHGSARNMNKARIMDWQLSFGYPNATEPNSHTTGDRTTIDTCLMKSWGAASTKQGQSEIWSLSVFELRS